MKLKLQIPQILQIQILPIVTCLLLSLAAAAAQTGAGVSPTTGLPIGQNPPAIDPNTGLPLPTPEPQWIDPNWGDPDIVLTNVDFNGLPLSEVANQLRERFNGTFDILPMPHAFNHDWGSEISVQLQLRNVRASDIFNAMNLVFENDRTPVRWELKATPHPLVLLRVLPQAESPPPPADMHRMVYFVGDLIGDEKSGGMTMDQIVEAIKDIWPADLGKPDEVIQFHAQAQLLVANGTREQLEFLNQAIAGLHQRAEWHRFKQKSEESSEPSKK